MALPPRSAVARVLEAVRDGDRKAASELVPLVYVELHKVASSLLSKLPPGQTLQTTALVHEAYLKLVGPEDPGWESRRHFFGAAAQAMREILVREARRKGAAKRGGGQKRVEFDEEALAIEPPSKDLLALDEALQKLERTDERKAKIVLLRFYSGLKMDEIAALLEISMATIDREWRFIRVWLQSQIGEV